MARDRVDRSDRALPAGAFEGGNVYVSGRRAMAHVLDSFLYGFFGAILIGVAAATNSSVLLAATILAVLVPGMIAYYVLTQRRSGRSPGKAMFGIRVVDQDGAVPAVGALIRRTIPLVIEYFYVIAFFAILTSVNRQRLGDRWAHTYVIDDSDEGHIERGQAGAGGGECPVCGELLPDERSLEAHVARFHPERSN
jgi:uncharacterized RDD family membrane protein YckC